MKTLLGLILATVLADPATVTVDVTTIGGPARTGELISADATAWTIKVEDSEIAIPASEILDVSLRQDAAPAAAASVVQLRLTDGSRLGAAQVGIADRKATLTLAAQRSIEAPADSVLSIRFGLSPSAVDEQWNALHARERRQDMLVVQKGETLDFVEGTIGNVTDAAIVLLLDGEQIEVPREKAFGVIYYRKPDNAADPVGFVELVGGDRLAVAAIRVEDTAATVDLTAGAEIRLPLSSVARFDLSTGKLTWLSSLDPRDVQHEFRFIDPAPTMANDRDVWGEPLKIGKQSFARGVAIRSKTELRYRLNGDFSRLQAWVGIQQGYQGDVRLQLSLDGEKVFDQIVEPGSGVVPVDLDVSDRFNLDVLVDYGSLQSDIGDHLILGNARLLR